MASSLLRKASNCSHVPLMTFTCSFRGDEDQVVGRARVDVDVVVEDDGVGTAGLAVVIERRRAAHAAPERIGIDVVSTRLPDVEIGGRQRRVVDVAA